MSVVAIITGNGPCSAAPLLRATVTVNIINSGPNAGCAEIIVTNSPSSKGFIGSLGLTVNNPGPFTQVSGPGNEGSLSGGKCLRGCLPNSDIVQKFKTQSQRINPGNSGTFVICSTTPFTEAQFQSIGLHFKGIEGNDSICLSGSFGPVTTTPTVCTIPNPQTCCQVVVEFKTKLVPPALVGHDVKTEVFFTQPPVVEDVCPEKVIICGSLAKKITFIAVDEKGKRCKKVICDERAFQCIIDRDDANEGDHFEVCGFAVLCNGTPRPQNFGTRPGYKAGSTVEVFWKVIEKDIVKVCIRKNDCNDCNPISPCHPTSFSD
ncbi:hypothetical protein NKR74_06000 [Bacillus sp. 3103sda1]|uniref:hypothetical protein n=1 Tax=Bacillus sp. 3103sda1 TaxID=2953808 RepID=UPI00209D29E6|nr:hypothetical protein [Bacillus sp. 3103sda1]MCP1122889.1 hypothetical protein [Bacillus sp. 3103sda1]